MIMKTQLRRRDVQLREYLPQLQPLLRRLYVSRGVKETQELERGVRGLLLWQQLAGIDTAVDLLQQTMATGQCIVIVGDFDADGATSTALAVLALRSMGAKNVKYLVPNRFEEGYGLSPMIVERVARQNAALIVTVDNGISSHAGVELAHQKGIRVLVTDHHLPGETLPNADAIINPNLKHCCFPSKSLAGVGVTFYLMLALRARLKNEGWFAVKTLPIPNLAELLDLVALGTVADVVQLDSNNRILVHQGLSRIRAKRCRPGIQALLDVAKRDAKNLVASDLGFFLGPRLNAAGRLDDMSIGVELLLSDDPIAAQILAEELNTLNQERREIEQGMQLEALALCNALEDPDHILPYGIAMYHKKWHQGVVGILASRIKERFHRPVIAFAPAGDGMLKGSGRSIMGLHLRDVLEQLNTQNPGLISKFGGHAMAAGLMLAENKFEEFRQRFADLVAECLDASQLEGVIWSDGELSIDELSQETAELLREAGPWGQAFPEPIFDGQFRILQQRLVGEQHLKLILQSVLGGPLLDGIAFNIDTKLWPNSATVAANLAYKLDINEFRGKRKLQLLVQQLWPI
ncbi:single-stranded-DNA-specific exonuclease RecJ [Candidatus Regiella insecticola]|uniref:Single-stranded-DNA-specific exonuclease RecJ n=3 Tax=Candidatus Regiella insecticola TaxID=138073 RepID=A0A6L2ZLB7_9ENTR|nr:single-stranded-DNA-specific exonuclease RecJ [Candidatus Regiella insecticola]GFN45081.1 single-stranded-DNA-specific exonuclease [Candidatus Regiella insecticola]